MEVFKKAFEFALAHEKSKVAIRTRRTYMQHINTLEKTIVGLKSQLVSKDSNLDTMGKTIDKLNVHLDSKKNEIVGLEGELSEVKTALEERDKTHSVVLQKFALQSNLFSATRKQLEQVTKENDDQSTQIWNMLEENCFLNKRILELDLEVQSLETILSKLKTTLEQAEQKTSVLGHSLKISQDGYEVKSREVLGMSVKEQQLRATVFNLRGELDQWKRNATWVSPTHVPFVHPLQIPKQLTHSNNSINNNNSNINDYNPSVQVPPLKLSVVNPTSSYPDSSTRPHLSISSVSPVSPASASPTSSLTVSSSPPIISPSLSLPAWKSSILPLKPPNVADSLAMPLGSTSVADYKNIRSSSSSFSPSYVPYPATSELKASASPFIPSPPPLSSISIPFYALPQRTVTKPTEHKFGDNGVKES